jgi:hypothetical protein
MRDARLCTKYPYVHLASYTLYWPKKAFHLPPARRHETVPTRAHAALIGHVTTDHAGGVLGPDFSRPSLPHT